VADTEIKAKTYGGLVETKKFIKASIEKTKAVGNLDIEYPCGGILQRMQIDNPIGFKTGRRVLGRLLSTEQRKQILLILSKSRLYCGSHYHDDTNTMFDRSCLHRYRISSFNCWALRWLPRLQMSKYHIPAMQVHPEA